MTAQITLFLDDSGSLHAEAPGANGARRKLSLDVSETFSLADVIRNAATVLADDLVSQRNKALERAQAEAKRQRDLARQRHDSIFNYVAANHGPALAKLIDPNYTFELALRRKPETERDRLREVRRAVESIQL